MVGIFFVQLSVTVFHNRPGFIYNDVNVNPRTLKLYFHAEFVKSRLVGNYLCLLFKLLLVLSKNLLRYLLCQTWNIRVGFGTVAEVILTISTE